MPDSFTLSAVLSQQYMRISAWLLGFLLSLAGLPPAHAQPAFQVSVTPAGPLNLPPGSRTTLTASTSYPAFAVGTGFNGAVTSTLIQADGKIVVGGSFTAYKGVARNRIARLNLDGSLDASFAPTGTGLDAAVNALVIQGDGKIVVGGSFTAYNGVARKPHCPAQPRWQPGRKLCPNRHRAGCGCKCAGHPAR